MIDPKAMEAAREIVDAADNGGIVWSSTARTLLFARALLAGEGPVPESDKLWIGVNSLGVPDLATLHVDERDCRELIDKVVQEEGDVILVPRRCILTIGESPVRSSGEGNSVAAGAAPMTSSAEAMTASRWLLDAYADMDPAALRPGEKHGLTVAREVDRLHAINADLLAALWNTLSFAQIAYGKLARHYQGEMSGFDGAQEIALAAIAKAEGGATQASDSLARPSSSPSPAVRDVTLREALEKAAEQFRFYEHEHLARAKREGDTVAAAERSLKAEANRKFAEMCEAALSHPSHPPEQ